ncbi:MAG: hotdog fold thioesterase [Chitinophagaceae bacterium]|nr:hotdog fold thioesterase [Chitinophagaceae bacterium]
MIWFHKDIKPEQLEPIMANTMAEFLELKIEEIGDDNLSMSIPVMPKTAQPYGFLHGGANCVLIETVGSIASAMVIDVSKQMCVGIEINASHLKSVKSGRVVATATPVRLGKTVHVWEVKIVNEKKELTCVGRLTVAVRNHRMP